MTIIAVILCGNCYFDQGVMLYAEQIAKTKASIKISDNIKSVVLEELDSEIVNITYNNEGSISHINLNAYKANIIMSNALDQLEEITKKEKFNDLYLPIGYAFSKSVFVSNGPKIRIRMKHVGSYSANIVSDIVDVGLNNSMLEVMLKIKLSYQIMIPLQEKTIEIESSIPLSTVIIQGEVPSIFYGVSWRSN